MPEPINPQDHSIQLGDGTSIEPSDAWRFSQMGQAHGMSLAEAIHQTFERDEYIVEYREKNAEKIAASRMSKWPPHSYEDPDTEIDRLARLIVDGEYRRRKEAHV